MCGNLFDPWLLGNLLWQWSFLPLLEVFRGLKGLKYAPFGVQKEAVQVSSKVNRFGLILKKELATWKVGQH